MLSIDEIIEKTGLTRYNFQAWRRNGLRLLPKPVSVDKRNILFDDSILERIKFIRDQQAAGHTLAQIETMIADQLAEEAKAIPSWEVMSADHDDFMEEIDSLRKKWERGECLDEVCAALKLDKALSGQPTTFVLPAVGKPAGGLMVYATIISNSVVHFVEMHVDLYDPTEVKQSAEIPVGDFGMLLYIIGLEFAEGKKVMKTEMIPYLLFHGFEGTGATSAFWMDALELAPVLNQITEASRQYLLRLRDKGGDFEILGK